MQHLTSAAQTHPTGPEQHCQAAGEQNLLADLETAFSIEAPQGEGTGLIQLFNEIEAGHRISRYGRASLHADTPIPYFSLSNGAYLVSVSRRRPERPYQLYILDYTCRHYVRIGSYNSQGLFRKLDLECERKLEK